MRERRRYHPCHGMTSEDRAWYRRNMQQLLAPCRAAIAAIDREMAELDAEMAAGFVPALEDARLVWPECGFNTTAPRFPGRYVTIGQRHSLTP